MAIFVMRTISQSYRRNERLSRRTQTDKNGLKVGAYFAEREVGESLFIQIPTYFSLRSDVIS